MTGATRYVTRQHPGVRFAKAGWWLLLQPGVVVGLVVLALGGTVHLNVAVALDVAVAACLAVTGAAIYVARFSVAARLRRAMVEVGLVHWRVAQADQPPRRRRRALRKGRNLVLRWELPPTVTFRKVEEHLEELECRLGRGLHCWFDGGLLHTEVQCHRLPELVEFADFYRGPCPGGELPVGIGGGRRGSVWVDLAELGHLLIGGITDSGKSVFIRQALARLSLTHPPSAVRFLLIDLKGGVALAPFEQLPHALGGAIDNATAALAALDEMRSELDRRLGELRRAGLADIAAWHESGLPRWPRLVVVVDEVAELTIGNIGGGKAAQAERQAAASRLCELARLGRAVGIHLVVCTQRPDAEAMPGQLKANLGGTLAFRVRNSANSHILLDSDRAALLPPRKGRAIWQHERMEEVQVVHLSQEECQRLLEERWLREVETVEDPGGIRRWAPVGTANWRAPAVRAGAVLGAVGERLEAWRPRPRGEGGEPPSADQGDGDACLEARHEESPPTATASLAVTPSLVTDDPLAQDVDAWTDANVELLGTRKDPCLESGAPHVTQPHQPTSGSPDVCQETA
jgi:hypothetical protein